MKALITKTLECNCGGTMEMCQQVEPVYPGVWTHRCNSCGYVVKVRGQQFPYVREYEVEAIGITDDSEEQSQETTSPQTQEGAPSSDGAGAQAASNAPTTEADVGGEGAGDEQEDGCAQREDSGEGRGADQRDSFLCVTCREPMAPTLSRECDSCRYDCKDCGKRIEGARFQYLDGDTRIVPLCESCYSIHEPSHTIVQQRFGPEI